MNTKRKTEKPLVIKQLINASGERIWKALTDNEELKFWFFGIREFKAQKGFSFTFSGRKGPKEFIHHCQIKEVVANKKISYSWRYEGHEGQSLVTIELQARGKKTLLILTHAGLSSFPATGDFAVKNFKAGWTYIMGTSLKKYIKESDREIVISRTIDASRERVWEAWTDPKQMVQWWGPTGFSATIEKMEVRPGGVWKQVMHGPDGTDYPNKSVFKELVKPERIVFSHAGGKKGAGVRFISTWTFEAVGPQKTIVTIRMVFATSKARDMVVQVYGAIEGGQQTLGRLNEFLNKR